jgi:thymidylate kinase
MVHIALEGIDGCGKSAQMLRLTSFLEAAGTKHEVYEYTKKRSERLRARIEAWRRWCGNGQRPLRFHERLVQEMLYAANARRNWRCLGKASPLIVADRSILTAFVAHRNLLPWAALSWRIIRLVEWSIPVPDGVILLDLEPAVADDRIRVRGQPRNADENLAVLKGMQATYHELRERAPLGCLGRIRWKIVDASLSEEAVAGRVAEAFNSLLLECGAMECAEAPAGA